MHSIPYNVWNKWDPIKEAIVGSCVNENYFENVKNWYALIKSRPTFRVILEESIYNILPSNHYKDLDF